MLDWKHSFVETAKSYMSYLRDRNLIQERVDDVLDV